MQKVCGSFVGEAVTHSIQAGMFRGSEEPQYEEQLGLVLRPGGKRPASCVSVKSRKM